VINAQNSLLYCETSPDLVISDSKCKPFWIVFPET